LLERRRHQLLRTLRSVAPEARRPTHWHPGQDNRNLMRRTEQLVCRPRRGQQACETLTPLENPSAHRRPRGAPGQNPREGRLTRERTDRDGIPRYGAHKFEEEEREEREVGGRRRRRERRKMWLPSLPAPTPSVMLRLTARGRHPGLSSQRRCPAICFPGRETPPRDAGSPAGGHSWA